MSPPKKHVVFDVVGTCVSYSAFYTRIDTILGPKLVKHNITPQHFGFTWQTSAELEFTFISIAESYKPYKDVLRALFYRTLRQCGVSDPRALATDDEREKCIEGYGMLALREGCAEALKLLRDQGFVVWCFTSGDVQRVKGYFDRAGVHMPVENIVSCDTVGLAKPALEAYQTVWKKLGDDDVKWFAAAHMWDVTAATKIGFRGAWSSVCEGEASLDIFDDKRLEVVAEGLVDMARQIVEKT
jgi:2-haloacid dehalogenase